MTIVEGVEDAERERPDALWSVLSHKAAALGVAGCVLLSHTPSRERCNLDQGKKPQQVVGPEVRATPLWEPMWAWGNGCW